MDNQPALQANHQTIPAAKKILAVDDEREIVKMLQVGLENHGYQVVAAFNGREAIDKALSEQPDLIVMDVMMPTINGFQALRQLKEDEATGHIPVIMLTARDEEADILNGWLRGADLYMTKPFDLLELVANVNRVLADSAQDDDEFFDSL